MILARQSTAGSSLAPRHAPPRLLAQPLRPAPAPRRVAACAIVQSSIHAAGQVASFSMGPHAAAAPPAAMLELQRLAWEAQMESEMWAHQITDAEMRQAAARAALDTYARRLALNKAALLNMRELLDDAKARTRLQHARVFAESVYVCGRQQRSDVASSSAGSLEEGAPQTLQPLPAEQHLAEVQAEATLQLQQYELRLKHMMHGVVAGMAAVEDLASGLPALVGGEEGGGATTRALVANNIVPHRAKGASATQPPLASKEPSF